MIQIKTGSETVERATLDEPIEHLKACHRRIEERLATLERAGAALKERRDEALAAIRSAFAFMESNGAIHTRDEEDSVFPRLRGRMTEEETAMVDDLEDDHLEADARYARLKAITARIEVGEPAEGEFRQTAAGLCALYRKHIEVEDSRLVEVARRELTGEQLASISVEMKQRRGLE
jgi:hemerythrin-like domain-containing protein